VETKWDSYNVYGDGLSSLKEKLKKLKRDLKIWNKDVFGYTNLQKQTIINKISELDKLDDESNLKDEMRLERRDLFFQLNLVNHREDALWKQKSRAKWIEEGNSNSKYFHSMVNWRRKKNEIKGVEIQGQWWERLDVVKGIVKDYFKERLTESTPLEIRLEKVDFQNITEQDNEMLTRTITEDEIREVVWQCEGTKSPEPDDFNLGFIKRHWGVIKRDVA